MAGAIKYAKASGRKENILVLMPDGASKYISKIFPATTGCARTDSWRRRLGTVRDLLAGKPTNRDRASDCKVRGHHRCEAWDQPAAGRGRDEAPRSWCTRWTSCATWRPGQPALDSTIADLAKAITRR